MNPQTPNPGAAIIQFAHVWTADNSVSRVARGLTCRELDALTALFGAAGLPDAAAAWIRAHTAHAPEACEGHSIPRPPAVLPADQDQGSPAPGMDYPFSICGVARAAAQLLGEGWAVKPDDCGDWGTYARISGPHLTKFTIEIDNEDDLLISYRKHPYDVFPLNPQLPQDARQGEEGVCLLFAFADEGVAALAGSVAAAIRAVTGHQTDDTDETGTLPAQTHTAQE
ncbi:hypothetical protein [Streptomyces longisporoflavus]|uniref:Uncharacterized protein n=1 Tax=Streptomyces longisporoflavus TaxID=28044 RepID=A0ABW7R329_9ACTN